MKLSEKPSLTPFNSEYRLCNTAELLGGRCPDLQTTFVDELSLKVEQARLIPQGQCETWCWRQTCGGSGVRFDFEPSFGRGFSEIIDLDDGVFLRVRNSVHKDPYSVWSCHEGDVVFTVLLSGGLSLGVQKPEGSWIWAPFALAGFNPQRCLACSSVAADLDVHLVSVVFKDVRALNKFGFPASRDCEAFLRRIETFTRSNIPALIDVDAHALSVAQDIIECPFEGTLRKLYMAGKARELACYVISGRESKTRATPRGHSRRLDQGTVARLVKARVDSDLSQSVAGDALAAEIGVSRNTIMRAFKAEFGTTLGQYVHEERLSQACRLLEETALPITDIALTIGYDKPGSFSDAFRQAYRCTPSQFRLSRHS